MKYVVIDIHREGTGDMYSTEHDDREEAIKEADDQWSRLTSSERKARTVYVLETVNPDEEASDHLDGTPIWQDGISTSAIWKVSDRISNDVLDELGSEVNDETRWSYEDILIDAENYGMSPAEFTDRYLEEVIID